MVARMLSAHSRQEWTCFPSCADRIRLIHSILFSFNFLLCVFILAPTTVVMSFLLLTFF